MEETTGTQAGKVPRAGRYADAEREPVGQRPRTAEQYLDLFQVRVTQVTAEKGP